MKIATMKQFKQHERLEDGLCPSCGAKLVFDLYNGVPYAICNNCDFRIQQTDDYGVGGWNVLNNGDSYIGDDKR